MIKKDSIPNPEEVLRQQLDIEKDLHSKGQEDVSTHCIKLFISTYIHSFLLGESGVCHLKNVTSLSLLKKTATFLYPRIDIQVDGQID